MFYPETRAIFHLTYKKTTWKLLCYSLSLTAVRTQPHRLLQLLLLLLQLQLGQNLPLNPLSVLSLQPEPSKSLSCSPGSPLRCWDDVLGSWLIPTLWSRVWFPAKWLRFLRRCSFFVCCANTVGAFTGKGHGPFLEGKLALASWGILAMRCDALSSGQSLSAATPLRHHTRMEI